MHTAVQLMVFFIEKRKILLLLWSNPTLVLTTKALAVDSGLRHAYIEMCGKSKI